METKGPKEVEPPNDGTLGIHSNCPCLHAKEVSSTGMSSGSLCSTGTFVGVN